jgi:hypothetical protein
MQQYYLISYFIFHDGILSPDNLNLRSQLLTG